MAASMRITDDPTLLLFVLGPLTTSSHRSADRTDTRTEEQQARRLRHRGLRLTVFDLLRVSELFYRRAPIWNHFAADSGLRHGCPHSDERRNSYQSQTHLPHF